jgi:hypothetical protein
MYPNVFGIVDAEFVDLMEAVCENTDGCTKIVVALKGNYWNVPITIKTDN